MSPLWSILADQIESGEQPPVRFFYGARMRADLFYLDELAAIAANLQDFKFVPALSHASVRQRPAPRRCGKVYSMIRKGVWRFSEKIMLDQEPRARWRFILTLSRVISGFFVPALARRRIES